MSRPGIFWLTFNPADIATAKQFMDSLKGDNTVDSLGLTQTIESVADVLFPATSTQHKRIRYQIFVPAIILSMYRSKQRIKPEYELTRLEYLLQQTLIASGEKYSVFGSTRGEALKYWPSTIYWASLNTLRIWGEEYLGRSEALELIEEHNRPKSPNDEGDTESVSTEIEPADGFEDLCKNIFRDSGMAKPLTFALEPAEARFLKKRYLDLFPKSITSYILKYGNRKFCRRGLFDLECPKNPELNQLLGQARTYSQIAMGANYAHRWALCRARRKSGRLSRDGEVANARHFEKWLANNLKDTSDWQYSDLTKALESLNGIAPQKGESEFIKNFLRYASEMGSPKQKLSALEKVVQKREEEVKGRNRSHFNNSDLQVAKNILGAGEYRDLYSEYRWEQGKANLEDIFTGLNRR